MKKLIFLLVILVVASYDLRASKHVSDEKIFLIGNIGNTRYFLEEVFDTKYSTVTAFWLRSYDDNMKTLKELLMEGEKEKIQTETGPAEFIEVIIFKDRLVLFLAAITSERPKRVCFYMQSIDPVSLTLNPDRTKLSEFETNYFRHHGFVNTETTKNDSLMMVEVIPPYKGKKNESFKVVMFNERLELQWERLVELSYKDKQIQLGYPKLKNNGDITLICTRSFTLKELKATPVEQQNQHLVIKLNNSGRDLTEEWVDIAKKSEKSAFSAPNGDPVIYHGDKAWVGGVDYAKNKRGLITGVTGCYVNLYDRQTMQLLHRSVKNIKNGTGRIDIDENQWNNLKKDEKFGGSGFVFCEPEFDSEGNAFYWGERYSKTESSVTTNYMGTNAYGGQYVKNSTTTKHIATFALDIFVFKVSPAGDILWVTNIPKYQMVRYRVGAKDDYSVLTSYNAYISGNKLLVVYNDLSENLLANRKKTARFNGKKGCMILAVVDENGNLKRKAISGIEKMFYPSVTEQFSDTEWLFRIRDPKMNKTFEKINLMEIMP